MKKGFIMSILNNLKYFIAQLFSGIKSADNIITGQKTDSGDKLSPIHQEKDTQRVANHLLKGEVTQEVKELRYRDYLVSESSRHYRVSGDEAHKIHITYTKTQFGGINHEICSGFDGETNSHTLKIIPEGTPRFDLSKHCSHFYVNLKDNDHYKISLYFDLTPNKDIATSKAFLNYIQNSIMTGSRLGGDFHKLSKIEFVTYKISSVENFIKYIFDDLTLTAINPTEKELELVYCAGNVTVENLIEKYKVEDLQEKYETKAKKYLPTGDVESNLYICELCGQPIAKSDGDLNLQLVNKFCCTECSVKELIKTNKE